MPKLSTCLQPVGMFELLVQFCFCLFPDLSCLVTTIWTLQSYWNYVRTHDNILQSFTVEKVFFFLQSEQRNQSITDHWAPIASILLNNVVVDSLNSWCVTIYVTQVAHNFRNHKSLIGILFVNSFSLWPWMIWHCLVEGRMVQFRVGMCIFFQGLFQSLSKLHVSKEASTSFDHSCLLFFFTVKPWNSDSGTWPTGLDIFKPATGQLLLLLVSQFLTSSKIFSLTGSFSTGFSVAQPEFPC